MATWTTIPDSSLEPGKPIRSIDALALRDNPVAIAEGAVGAPKVIQWFPHDYETGGNGVIYSFAIDGAVASVTTPDFVAGWDYLLIAKDINDSTAVATTINIELYPSPVNAYQAFSWMPLDVDSSTLNRSDGIVYFSVPMESSLYKSIETMAAQKVAANVIRSSNRQIKSYAATANQQVLRARVRSSASANINSGTLTLLKRYALYPEIV